MACTKYPETTGNGVEQNSVPANKGTKNFVILLCLCIDVVLHDRLRLSSWSIARFSSNSLPGIILRMFYIIDRYIAPVNWLKNDALKPLLKRLTFSCLSYVDWKQNNAVCLCVKSECTSQ